MNRSAITSAACFAVAALLWSLAGPPLAAPALAQEEGDAQKDEKITDPNDPGFILEDSPSYRRSSGDNQCIFFRTLYDWRALNRTHLIVWAPSRKQAYLLQLDRPCWGLRFTNNLGFYSRDSSLCPYGGDAIIVDDGIGNERCTIGSITKLTDESLKSILDQAPGRRRASQDEDEAENDAE